MTSKIEIIIANSFILKKDSNKIVTSFPDIQWGSIKEVSLALAEHLVENDCLEGLPEFQPFCEFHEDKLFAGVQFNSESDDVVIEVLIQSFILFLSQSKVVFTDHNFGKEISVKSTTAFLSKKNGKLLKTPLLINFNDKKYYLNGNFSTIDSVLFCEVKNDVIFGSVVGISRLKRQVTILCGEIKFLVLFDIHHHVKDLIELFSTERSTKFNIDIEKNAKQKTIFTLRGICD